MLRTIFYSWQSELPNDTNRSLVERALETAAKAIRSDDSIAVEPVLDRDTSGVAGSPEISNTIFRKIEACAVFVADVSIVNRGSQLRMCPNPNVLIELGYALRSVSPERIVMVMNTHFGGPELLPFDLRLRRVITYGASPEESERPAELNELARQLEGHIRLVLTEIEREAAAKVEPERTEELIQAMRGKRDDRVFTARSYLDDFYSRLFSLAPSTSPTTDEELVTALEGTLPLVAEFARVASVLAALDDRTVATAVYRHFGRVLARYDVPYGTSNSHRESDFDFYRFLGHELFVTFIAPLLHERHLDFVKSLLDQDLEANTRLSQTRRRTAPYHGLSEWVRLFMVRKQRLQLISAHGTLLEERHSRTPLEMHSPFDHFMGADYFLFLHSESIPKDGRIVNWFPPTAVYLARTCTFLERLHRKDFAGDVARVIGLPGIEDLRTLIRGSAGTLAKAFGGFWDAFPEAHDTSIIGSR